MEEIAKRISALEAQVANFKQLLNIEEKRATMEKLQLAMASPNFWQLRS